MREHCRHCEDECPGGLPIPAWPHPEPHMNDDGAEWPSGHCPACAEAERIATALQRAHGVVDHDCQSQDEHDGLLRAQDVVAKIARGET